MKSKTHIIVLFFIALVFPVHIFLTYSSLSKKQYVATFHSLKKDNCSNKKMCCEKRNDQKQDCSGSCKNISCYCITTTPNMLFFIQDAQLTMFEDLKKVITYWIYTEQVPKTFYLSIWQPPKIS